MLGCRSVLPNPWRWDLPGKVVLFPTDWLRARLEFWLPVGSSEHMAREGFRQGRASLTDWLTRPLASMQ
jgi:hypothetical protein